ncbi:MAG: uroporphyrinogen decarboxylase family protein [Armatimonadota bacterium]|nr:uroporphyrinogen decarboxylase family protein [Armatimonadota bacterium]
MTARRPVLSLKNRNENTENELRVIQFQHPRWIPARIGLLSGTWQKHREELEEIVLRHPLIFPGYQRGSRDFDDLGHVSYACEECEDAWGCRWENLAPGMVGQVVMHPLEDWSALKSYEPPNLLEIDSWGNPRDWDAVARGLDAAEEAGGLRRGGGLYHGFMFMRLYYLRGFENLMIDVATADPRLDTLIEMILEQNQRVIDRCLSLGVEYMSFGDDLGNQVNLPISPGAWRHYVGPCYQQMYGACRDAGAHVYMHSDGDIKAIIVDLVEAGVTAINPQIRANGLEHIERICKGRVAINLDLDRQLFPFATEEQIDEHIRTAVETLALPEGGLMLSAECAPDVPLANIEAICEAFERYCF